VIHNVNNKNIFNILLLYMNEADFKRAKANARKIGVVVKRSTRKNKRLDVFRKGVKIASVGDSRYNNYHSYIRTKGKEFADKRRALYKIRHNNTRKKKDSPSYFADRLLWD